MEAFLTFSLSIRIKPPLVGLGLAPVPSFSHMVIVTCISGVERCIYGDSDLHIRNRTLHIWRRTLHIGLLSIVVDEKNYFFRAAC